MLFKVAIRNIRRSVRDYAIYFVTLLVAVTVFYAFNSVSDQQIMQQISSSNKDNIISFTKVMLGLFSIVVALVMGFLVIYANQLLVRRRKHEFGMYFTLGMAPGQVSRIILYETLLVGAVSLAVGLGLGVLLSQGLSVIAAGMFGIIMPDYRFEFSGGACLMTLACFAAIFMVVAVFNVVAIRRRTLIDLLNARSANQRVAIRNPRICLALLILSLVLLAIAYWQLAVNGMTLIMDEHFIAATMLMFAGTLLFFFSLAGFLIAVLTSAKRFYLKGLRPFTIRQVASKANTSFASMWVVCVLLFFAITTFATGLALVEAITGETDQACPYDCTAMFAQNPKDGEFDIRTAEGYLQQNVEGWSDAVSQSAQLDMYRLPGSTYGAIMDQLDVRTESDTVNESVASREIAVVGLSQFNATTALAGDNPVELPTGCYLIANNIEGTATMADTMIEQNAALDTPAGPLRPAPEVVEVQFEDSAMLSTGLVMVVPDEVIARLSKDAVPETSYVNANYREGSAAVKMLPHRVIDLHLHSLAGWVEKADLVDQAMGLRMVITYLALYIGFVLLVATAAVLAIQMLSLTADSLGRYRMLWRLGCDAPMIHRSLFAQTLVYFLLPLGLAACHSAWAISVMRESLFTMMGRSMLPSITASAALVIAVYGGYMLVTYLSSRAAVRQALSACQ